MSFHISAITAFVSVDEDDEEGIIGMKLPDGTWMPFIGADSAMIDSLRPRAEEIAKITGKQVRMVRFSVREDVETIEP